VLLATQKALRVAASLDDLDPPRTTVPYHDGIRWAARALVAAAEELGIEVVAESRAAAGRLDAVD
jgi:hypothetical protein